MQRASHTDLLSSRQLHRMHKDIQSVANGVRQGLCHSKGTENPVALCWLDFVESPPH